MLLVFSPVASCASVNVNCLQKKPVECFDDAINVEGDSDCEPESPDLTPASISLAMVSS